MSSLKRDAVAEVLKRSLPHSWCPVRELSVNLECSLRLVGQLAHLQVFARICSPLPIERDPQI
jgi:hypothetical protein